MAFRRHTLLPLDDCLYALQPTIPQLTRSSLHRCLQRHGISRPPEVEGDKATKKAFKAYPIGFFHIDIAEVQTAEGKLHLFVAIYRAIKDATVKRFHYDSHDRLRRHLHDFVAAHNFARRLKRLRGLTPYEFICKAWADQPNRFTLNPHHQMPGPSAFGGTRSANAIQARGGVPAVVGIGTWGGPAALARLQAHNARVRRVRSRIEKVFGTCKRSYSLRRMRWLGLAKAGLQVRLTAIAYNLRRTASLLRNTTA